MAKFITFHKVSHTYGNENYKIKKLLGAGAFGKVHLATSIKTGRDVAIKFISNKKIAEAKIHE